MGRVGEAAGFAAMFSVVASFPLLGLGALGWFRPGRIPAPEQRPTS
jgi:hypothetical protein